MVRLYPVEEKTAPKWDLPAPLELGKFLAPVDDWRELAHRT